MYIQLLWDNINLHREHEDPLYQLWRSLCEYCQKRKKKESIKKQKSVSFLHLNKQPLGGTKDLPYPLKLKPKSVVFC